MSRIPATPATDDSQGKLIKFPDLVICVADPSFGSTGSNTTTPFQASLRTKRFTAPDQSDSVANFLAQRDLPLAYGDGSYAGGFSQGFWYRKARCVSWRQTTIYIGGKYASLSVFGVTHISAACFGSPHLASRFPSAEPYHYFLIVLGLGSTPKITILGIRDNPFSATSMAVTHLSSENFSLPLSSTIKAFSGFTATTWEVCYLSELTSSDFYFYTVKWDELFTTVTTQEIAYGNIGDVHSVRVNSSTGYTETTSGTQVKPAIAYLKAEEDSFFFLGHTYETYSTSKDEGVTGTVDVSVLRSGNSNLVSSYAVFEVKPSGVTKVFDVDTTATDTLTASESYLAFDVPLNGFSVYEGTSSTAILSTIVNVFYFSGINRECLFKVIDFTSSASIDFEVVSLTTVYTHNLAEARNIKVYFQTLISGVTTTNLVKSDSFSNSYTFTGDAVPIGFGFIADYDETVPMPAVRTVSNPYIAQDTAYTPRMVLSCMHDQTLQPYTPEGAALPPSLAQQITVLIDLETKLATFLPGELNVINSTAPVLANKLSGVGVAQRRF